MHKIREFGIIILLFTLLILFLFLNYQNPHLLWDENAYLGNARSHLTESRYTEDYRFPLLEYIIAFIWKLTGESIFIAKLIIILFSLSTVYVFYLICKEHFNKYLLLITLFFGLNPLLFKWGFRVYTDIPSLFFVLLAYYLIIKKNIFLAGIFSAIAFLTRFPSALFALTIGIYLLYNKKFKNLLIFSVGFGIALFPWLLYNQLTYSNILWDVQNQYNIVSAYTSREPISKYFTNLINKTSVFLLLFPIGLFYILKNKKHFIISLYILIAAIYYSAFVNLKLERYLLVILPFIYIIGFKGFEYLTKNIKNKKIIFLFLSIIAIFAGILFFEGLGKIIEEGDCNRDGAIMKSIEYIGSKNLTHQVIIANIFPYYGYHNNLETYHIWSENIQALLMRYHPSYFIHSNYDGTYFNRTILDKNRYLRLEERFKDKCNAEVSVYKVV